MVRATTPRILFRVSELHGLFARWQFLLLKRHCHGLIAHRLEDPIPDLGRARR